MGNFRGVGPSVALMAYIKSWIMHGGIQELML